MRAGYGKQRNSLQDGRVGILEVALLALLSFGALHQVHTSEELAVAVGLL
jgi:hypothetical protein